MIQKPGRRLRLIAGGDVMLGRQMPGLVALHGAAWPLAAIATQLRAADLVLVNLEVCLAMNGDFLDKGGRQPYYYHAPPAMLDVLTAVGVNCLATANNHAMDYGPEAMVRHCEALDAAGFAYAGTGRTLADAARPAMVRVDGTEGLTVAFISVETETPDMQAGTASPGVFHLAVEQLARDLAAPLAEARAQADVVIVTPHWGANWREAPTDAIRAAAHALIDQGADAVLGHSAHILQGIELRHGRPIVYDMGTLLFDRVGQDRMSDAALFELELSADGVHGLTLHPLRLSEGQAHPATGEDARRIRERVAGLTRELDPEIAFDALDESLCLDCTPVQRDCPVATNVGTIPIRELRADAPPSLPATWRGQPANLIYATLPVDCGWTHRVAINNDIEVLGARFASPVRPGYGFVCEVYFRASAPPMPSRVEARLVGLDAHGEAAFSYTHPVAEGICPTSRWNRNAVICDRVLVRPGKELAPGRYTLSWQLIDRDKHISIVVTGRDERLVGGRVVIGQFEVSRNAPRGVAGIARPLRLPRADARFPHRAWQADPIRYWMAQVRPWALRALTFSNVRAAREGTVVEVVRNNPWGLVISFTTDHGKVFFKAAGAGGGFEPRLLAELSKSWPHQVPRPLAILPSAGWMLTPNVGPTALDGHPKAKADDALWQAALDELASIQIEAARDPARWLALGVPDRRMRTLPDRLTRLLDDDGALALGQPHGLLPAERDAARALLPLFRDVCLSLAMMPGATSLDQGDPHPGNIVPGKQGHLLLDWGDATVTHPFGVLLLAHHRSKQRNAESLARLDVLATPYLERWREMTGLDDVALREALHFALWTATVNRALNWAVYASLDERTAAGNTRVLAARWIRFWLQDAELLTRRFVVIPSPRPENPALATENNPLLLDPATMARVTGGTWHNLPPGTLLTGMCHNRKYLASHTQGNVFFPINNPASNESFGAANIEGLHKAFAKGAVAAIVPLNASGLPVGTPLLHTPGSALRALEALGKHVRDHLFHGTRVVVTGTEGKTGFKCMLHHVLTPQIPIYAMLNSTNLDFSIHASFASIRKNDRIAIFEAAGTHPGRCKRRSEIVKPHVFVITEVGNEHINFHGSQEAVIEGKADICLGLEENGYGILNADSRNYEATRAAVLKRKNVPLLLFGSGPECHGRLLSSRFEQTDACSGWHVAADIQGTVVEYCLPLLGEHAPLASVSVLLAARLLGADVAQAAASLASFVPYESSGALRRIQVRDGEAQLFDHSTRASVLSYQSFLRTAARLMPSQPRGRKIALIGQMIFLGDEAEREHAQLAEWIEAAGFDCMIFVGRHMETTHAHLTHKSRVVKRFPGYDRRKATKRETRMLIDALLDLVRPGDLLFVKGEVDEVGEHLRGLEVRHA